MSKGKKITWHGTQRTVKGTIMEKQNIVCNLRSRNATDR